MYHGNWADGKQHGRGTYIKDGKKREGIWKQGKRTEWIKSSQNQDINDDVLVELPDI